MSIPTFTAMESAFFQYLFEASLSLGIVFIVYRLLLHHNLLFVFNRFFILAALALAAVAPLIELPAQATVKLPMPAFRLAEVSVNSTPEVSSRAIRLTDVLWWLYWSGVLITFARLLLQLNRLYQWKRALPAEKRDGYWLINTGGQLPTFSFFHYLFWDNSQALTQKEEALVLAHEQTYIRQYHSFDVLVLEFFKILFWFHPAVYAFAKAQRAVHEYLADQAALRQGSAETYLKLLTHSLLKKLDIRLVQSFYQSPLKNRMKMLQLAQTARPVFWKAGVSLAMVSLTIILFACRDRMKATNPEKILVSGQIVNSEGKPLSGAQVFIKGTNTGTTADATGRYTLTEVPSKSILEVSFTGYKAREISPIGKKTDIVLSANETASDLDFIPPMTEGPKDNEPFVAVEEMPEFPGGTEEMKKYLSENIKYPENARKNNVHGKVYVAFVVRENGTITEVNEVKGVDAEIDAEAVRVVKKMPQWIPGKQSGKTVPVRYVLPIEFAL